MQEEIKLYKDDKVKVLSRYDTKSGRWVLIQNINCKKLRVVHEEDLQNDKS